MKILADATLPNISALFRDPFRLTLYNTQNDVADLIAGHDILACRSTLNVSAKLLANSAIQCVATASSGIDHIDSDYLMKHGIVLFDAKGSNARAVADYVVATLAFLNCNRRIIGNKAGVIGVGEIGTRVVARLQAAGFDVICFDPFKAKLDKHYHVCSLSELTSCDLLCVHANLHHTEPYPSVNLLATDFLKQLKSGTTIINTSRGGIVNEKELLDITKPLTYCTDVYAGEPAINAKIVDFSTLCTPHIAGLSIEAKNNAVLQIRQQIYRHYGLCPPPPMLPIAEPGPLLPLEDSWHASILRIYNPLADTLILKKASDKKLAFLTQRQAHSRHDFSFYNRTHVNLRL